MEWVTQWLLAGSGGGGEEHTEALPAGDRPRRRRRRSSRWGRGTKERQEEEAFKHGFIGEGSGLSGQWTGRTVLVVTATAKKAVTVASAARPGSSSSLLEEG